MSDALERDWRIVRLGVALHVGGFVVAAAVIDSTPGSDPVGTILAGYGMVVAASLIATAGAMRAIRHGAVRRRRAVFSVIAAGGMLSAGSLVWDAVTEATGSATNGVAWLYLAGLLLLLGGFVAIWAARRRDARQARFLDRPEAPVQSLGQRFRRGWREANRCWSLILSEPSLLVLPAASFAFVIATWAALYIAVSGWVDGFQTRALLVALLGAYPLNLVGTYFGVAFVAAADGRLRGHSTTLAEGLRIAWAKLPVIARWALLASGVGLLLQALQQIKSDWLATPLLNWLAGAAWTVLTFFVLPIIAFEETGVRESIRRSGRIVKERWGEGISGAANITVPFGLLMFAIVFISAIAVAAGFAASSAGGIATSVAIGIVLALALLVYGAMTQLLSLVLYRFATGHGAIGGFSSEELQQALVRKRRKRRFPWLRR